MVKLVHQYCPTLRLIETSPRCHCHLLLPFPPCQASALQSRKNYTYPHAKLYGHVTRPPITSLTLCSRFPWLHWHPLDYACFSAPSFLLYISLRGRGSTFHLIACKTSVSSLDSLNTLIQDKCQRVKQPIYLPFILYNVRTSTRPLNGRCYL